MRTKEILGLADVKGSVKPPERKVSSCAAQLLRSVKLLFVLDAL